MNLDDFSECIAKLAAAYREKLADGTVEVYYNMLGAFDAIDLEYAVQHWILTSPWFPKVSELREHMVSHRRARQPALESTIRILPGSCGDGAWPERMEERARILAELGQEDRMHAPRAIAESAEPEPDLAAHERKNAAALDLLRRAFPDLRTAGPEKAT